MRFLMARRAESDQILDRVSPQVAPPSNVAEIAHRIAFVPGRERTGQGSVLFG
jgi:hypothetical protein